MSIIINIDDLDYFIAEIAETELCPSDLGLETQNKSRCGSYSCVNCFRTAFYENIKKPCDHITEYENINPGETLKRRDRRCEVKSMKFNYCPECGEKLCQ